VAFDRAKCTVPNCSEVWWNKFGYVPGCQIQDVESFHYQNALWYSFPGRCPQKNFSEACLENEWDAALEPGGACRPTRTPTGTWNCTYTYEPVGEVLLDQLVGITENYKSYREFCQDGGVEFNGPDDDSDEGVTLDFWRGYRNITMNQQRVQALEDLFTSIHRHEKKLPDPVCTGPQPANVVREVEETATAPPHITTTKSGASRAGPTALALLSLWVLSR